MRLIETPPSRNIRNRHTLLCNKLEITSGARGAVLRHLQRNLNSFRSTSLVPQMPYKGVTALVGLNIATYMILNSRFMKQRSHADGLPRSDRHFMASKYNVSQGRLWCIPLSIFNHGDSLFRLGMNCLGLSIVGPAVELAFGPAVVISGFLFSGTIGAIAEMLIGNHWCRGSSAAVTGLFGIGAFTSPYQMLSIWGIWDVRAASLAISIFGFESIIGLLGSGSSETAHISHAAGIAAAIPFLYYIRWFR